MTQSAKPAPGQPEVRELPLQMRELQIVPGSFDAERNTVDVTWTTGSMVRRYDWWNDTPYDEELVVTPEAVDMSRFEAGAVSVLDSHSRWDLRSVIGIATRGWLEGSEGRATLQLSKRESLAETVADIAAGIIRNISVGYSVQRFEIVRAVDRTDGINVPLYRAVRWQPAEISFVAVPADAGAGTREAAEELQKRSHGNAPCEFIRAAAQPPQESSMSQTGNTQPGGNTNPPATDDTQRAAELERQRAEAARAEQQRGAAITDLCVRNGVPKMAAELIRSGKSVEQAGLAIAEQRAADDAAQGGHRNVSQITTERDEQETRLRGIEEAVLNRVDSRHKLDDNGRRFRGMSLLELGRSYLESLGVRTEGMDRMTLAARMLTHRSGGFHTTSDFGSVLANVATKRLRQAYEENPGSYTRWARRAPNAPDFKSMSVVQLSSMPDLLQINEHGEFKYGALRDGAETYGLLTYGRIVGMSRQAIVNDDLRAFDRLATGFGAASARLENRTVYSQLTANAALSDSIALFNASHGNLGTGAGSALQFSALTSMRTAMRLQKGLQNEELNLVPAYLIVPAALEQTAYQLTSSQYVPATQATVSEFRSGGRTALDPVVEPILDANSATAWYAAANSTQVDTIEYCYLDGAEGPVLDSEMGFEIDGVSFKARLDFAAKAIDYRGLYKANGV